VPSAVVLTSRDQAVPPSKQRELAATLRAPIFEAPIDHIEITSRAERYNPALLDAIAAVRAASGTNGDGRLRAQSGAPGPGAAGGPAAKEDAARMRPGSGAVGYA
jgi:hypothetical protein